MGFGSLVVVTACWCGLVPPRKDENKPAPTPEPEGCAGATGRVSTVRRTDHEIVHGSDPGATRALTSEGLVQAVL
jgi:hypothetical protein